MHYMKKTDNEWKNIRRFVFVFVQEMLTNKCNLISEKEQTDIMFVYSLFFFRFHFTFIAFSFTFFQSSNCAVFGCQFCHFVLTLRANSEYCNSWMIHKHLRRSMNSFASISFVCLLFRFGPNEKRSFDFDRNWWKIF